jgi:hypothetical protein
MGFDSCYGQPQPSVNGKVFYRNEMRSEMQQTEEVEALLYLSLVDWTVEK